MKKAKVKYYVVWVGQNPGIYNSWKDCQAQILGFPNAKYKSFPTIDAAQKAYKGNPADFMERKNTNKLKTSSSGFSKEIIQNSLSVDAACSRNPGIMEYRGVITSTGEEIFRMGPFHDGTNNIGEFLALVHALALLKVKGDSKTPIYSDSRTAMSWLRNMKVKSTLERSKNNVEIFDLLERAMNWLNKNKFDTIVLKWDTKRWGEIPADFGRK